MSETSEVIARSVRERLPDARVEAAVEGNRALITVVSAEFEGLSRVRRQQAVYGCIDALIADGTLHAVSIRALTPDQEG